MSFRHLITVAPIRYILRCIYIHSYVVLCFVCFVMVTQAFMDLCGTFTIPSQWTRDAIIASVLRQNNVATSFWPHNDVIIASCVLWEGCFFNTVVIMWLPQYQRSNPGIDGYIRPVPKHDKHNKLSSKRPYRQISWRPKAARLDVLMIISLRNLTGISAALLPRCLSNFRVIPDTPRDLAVRLLSD